MSTKPETVRIAGVGHAAPANIRPNSEILKAFPNRTEEEVVRLTGIKERRHAAEDESATDLAHDFLCDLGAKIEKPPKHRDARSSRQSTDRDVCHDALRARHLRAVDRGV